MTFCVLFLSGRKLPTDNNFGRKYYAPVYCALRIKKKITTLNRLISLHRLQNII